jgi:hypothetical protein
MPAASMTGLITFLQHVVAQEFLRPAQASLLIHDPNAASLLERLKSFKPDRHDPVMDQAAAAKII